MKLILSAVLTSTLASVALTAFAGAESDIKYRQSVMKTAGGHIGALGAILKGEVTHKQDIAFHVDGLAGVATMTSHLFPLGSGEGKTKAKAEVWSQAAEFDSKVKDFQKAALALQTAAKGNDPAAIGAALGGVGKSCKGCHDKFQSK